MTPNAKHYDGQRRQEAVSKYSFVSAASKTKVEQKKQSIVLQAAVDAADVSAPAAKQNTRVIDSFASSGTQRSLKKNTYMANRVQKSGNYGTHIANTARDGQRQITTLKFGDGRGTASN